MSSYIMQPDIPVYNIIVRQGERFTLPIQIPDGIVGSTFTARIVNVASSTYVIDFSFETIDANNFNMYLTVDQGLALPTAVQLAYDLKYTLSGNPGYIMQGYLVAIKGIS